MGKDLTYVETAFSKGYITQEEKEAILATPQVNQE